jgi:hypothetical protein
VIHVCVKRVSACVCMLRTTFLFFALAKDLKKDPFRGPSSFLTHHIKLIRMTKPRRKIY